MLLTVAMAAIGLVCLVGVIICFMAVHYLIARSSKTKAAALLETGQQGEATILSLEDTGVRINDAPWPRG